MEEHAVRVRIIQNSAVVGLRLLPNVVLDNNHTICFTL